MTRLAGWCFHHRYIVLALWILVLAGTAVTSRALGTSYTEGLSVSGTESAQAQTLLSHSGLQAQAGDDTIVLHTNRGLVTDASVRSQVASLVATVATLPHVHSVRSPFATTGTPQSSTAQISTTQISTTQISTTQISTDQRTAVIALSFDEPNANLVKADVQPVVNAGAALRSASLNVQFGGLGFQSLKGRPAAGSEGIGLIAAAIVLLLAFGSLLSMAIPLISAIFALGTAIETIGLTSHLVSINALAPTIAALIGLGVGIDYALFIVTRHRNGVRAGLSPEESARTALNTSGRAVIFAGGTVAIAMIGLLVLRISFLTGVGVAAAITVFFAVAAACTLLPAIFGMFGSRVLSRRERRAMGTAPDADSGRFWVRWSAYVQRRPLVGGLIAAAVMVVLAVPAFSIRLGSSDQGNDPAASTTRQAYDLLANGFGAGYNGPLQLVADAPTASDRAALSTLVTTLRGTAGVASVTVPPAGSTSAISVIQVTPTGSPQSTQTADLIDHLRHGTIPSVEAGTTLHVYVGGQTATFQDFAGALTSKLALFITVVIVLGCLLLMIAFRSIVVPLTAAVMNVLAAGASFGVVVAVFQWGWGSELLGLGKPGPIESFLPVMLIAILFGLSMDYQVFLVSRMHEEWVSTNDNHRAVRVGQAATGRVITAAAAIMICVFLAFVFGGRRPIGEFGLGLATAILLDALLLRTVLVPAAMHLFGRANWWIPGWLDRVLPHLSVDAPARGKPTAPTAPDSVDPGRRTTAPQPAG